MLYGIYPLDGDVRNDGNPDVESPMALGARTDRRGRGRREVAVNRHPGSCTGATRPRDAIVPTTPATALAAGLPFA